MLKFLLLCCLLKAAVSEEQAAEQSPKQKRLSAQYGEDDLFTPGPAPGGFRPGGSRPGGSPPPQQPQPQPQRPGGFGPSPSPPPPRPFQPQPPSRPFQPRPTNGGNSIFEVMPAGQMAMVSNVDVQCAMTSMRVRITFDRPFDGVIYTKGFFSSQECHYVPYGGNKQQYEFELQLDRCGTQFVDNLAVDGKAYLENILLVQYEPGLQEMWDSARMVQCEWNGKVERPIDYQFQVDMLEITTLKYNGDDIKAEMDIRRGRGPKAPRVSGLLKIGEDLTLVISVQGAGDMDVRVKDCVAHDGDRRNGIQLTDERGCVVKRKLMGAWQFTRSTSQSGSTLVAFALLQAFRFPDKTDVYMQCALEICKGACQDHCPDYPTALEPGSNTRYRREANQLPPVDTMLLKGIRVMAESELAIIREQNGTLAFTRALRGESEVCMSTVRFTLGVTGMVTLLLLSFIVTAFVCLRFKLTKQLAEVTHSTAISPSKLGWVTTAS